MMTADVGLPGAVLTGYSGHIANSSQ